ncbi:MAG: PAS domain S-box protein [Methanoregula sp.]|nr:PAS domain S-box protein [Methanoregula sp.]
MADRIRVLIVDDESVLLEMGKLFLEQSGEFSVDTVISAPAALDILNKINYDVIVSDYQMPDMDGIEFLKRIRAADKSIPFIIFTGRSREDVVIEALNNGPDFYLQRGGNPKTLFRELVHVIRQSVQMRRTLMTLAEQEQRYHDLQNANDLIQSIAPDGHFLFVNKKWLDTLGYQEHELSNLTILDIIHEESLKHYMETFQQVISGENVGIIDAVFRTRNGRKVYVEGMANCKTVEGRPQYTRGIFKDVTDRKKADAALKESEARYRNVVENQTEFISRFRPDGTYVFVNDAYCLYFSKTREEIIGKRYTLKIPEADRTGVTRHLASLTREHPVATASNRIIMEDGRIRWQQWSNRAIFDDEGHVLEYQSVGRDITDLKEAEHELLRKNKEINAAFEELTATEEELRHNYDLLSEKEQALRETEETFRAIEEQSVEGIIIVDFSGILQFANGKAWDIIGYPSKMRTAGTFNVLEIVSPEYRVNAIRDFLQISHGLDSDEINYKIITFEKKERWIECIGKKISYKGSPAMLLSFRDITERRNAESAMEESEKKFRTIFENIPYPISINSIPDGKFIAINAAFLQSCGYSETEILGKSPVEIGMVSLMDFGRLTSHLLLSGRTENVPMVLERKGGIRVHVQFSTIPVTINHRPAIMTMTAEITKLRRVEEELHQKNQELTAAFEELTATKEELRQNYDQLAAFRKTIEKSEARFRTLFTISPDGIILLDLTGRITYASPDALMMFRISSIDKAVGTSVFDWVEPEYHEMVQGAMVQLLDGKFRCSITYRVRRRDGSSFFVETSQGFFPDENGRPDGLMVIIRDITDRQHAEMVLRESEENFRKIFENSALGMTLTLPDLRFLLVNPAWVSMTGYTKEEFRKMSFKDITHPDNLSGDIENIRALEAGTIPVYSTEKRYIRKDGSTLWGALKVTTVRNLNGTLRHYITQIEDITPRKQAEEALRESEEKLALVMDGVPTLIAYLDSELHFVYINKAQKEWYGLAEKDLIGKSLKELLPEDEFLRALPYYQQVLSGREVNFENPTRDRDGREHVLSVRLVPYVHGEQVVGFFAALDDITERKRMEESLRESEENFHSMFENHDSIMLLIEPETGKIIDANLAAERFYSRARKELCTLSIEEINTLPLEVIASERAKAAQGRVTFFTVPHRTESGEVRIVEVHSSPIARRGKTILFSIIHDVTERRQAEEALQQANKKLNLLSGITRHDITNQLLALNGFVELLHLKIPDPSFEGYFSRITKASSQINAMITFSKEYEQIGVRAPVWQNLQTLVNSAGNSASLGQVTLKNDMPANTEVFADPLIVKVFFNLIDNAVRHGRKMTTIRFSFETRNGDRIIVCEDDGNGVVNEEKKRIFDRGFGKNTGFGLAISREILDITGITIKETGKPGDGARFEITVPKEQCRHTHQ